MAKVDDANTVPLIDEKDMNFRKTFAVVDLLGKAKSKTDYWAELNDRKSMEDKIKFLRDDKTSFIDKTIFDELKTKTEGLDNNSKMTTENLLNVMRPEVNASLNEYNASNYKIGDKVETSFQLSSMKDFKIENFEDIKPGNEEDGKVNQKLFKQLHQDIVFMQNAKGQVSDTIFLQMLLDNKESTTHLINLLSYLTK